VATIADGRVLGSPMTPPSNAAKSRLSYERLRCPDQRAVRGPGGDAEEAGDDVACQSHGTTPLPEAWDHLAPTTTG